MEKWISKSALKKALLELRSRGIHAHAVTFLGMKLKGVNTSSFTEYESARDQTNGFYVPYFKVGEYSIGNNTKAQYYKIFDGTLTPKTTSSYPHSSGYSPWRASREQYIRDSIEWRSRDPNDFNVKFKDEYDSVLKNKFFSTVNKIPLPDLSIFLQAKSGGVDSEKSLQDVIDDWKIKLNLTPIELKELFETYDWNDPEEPFQNTPLSTDEVNEIIISQATAPTHESRGTLNNEPRSGHENKHGISLNTILYGPPGTGKTYSTAYYAVAIIENEPIDQILEKYTPQQIFLKFREYISSEFIKFITFHQSYSYEEFIEGIKPVTTHDNEIAYEIRDGVFKAFARSVGYVPLRVGDVFTGGKRSSYQVHHLDDTLIEFKTVANSIIPLPKRLVTELFRRYYDGEITDADIKARKTQGTPLQDILDTKYDKYIFGYDGLLVALLQHLKKTKDEQIPTDDFQNYVFIVDEISRGNIANIFGELITLIEDDKRAGASHYVPARLPYSNEEFGVPERLYIIGTMNTADRSVETLDTALRRRFSFVEMNPEPSRLSAAEFSCDGIDLRQLLQTINDRIEKLLDKDHCIGHAYFMGIRNREAPELELSNIFLNRIIPLLQEYFYGDWGKILLVLGPGFVKLHDQAVKFASTDYEGLEEYEQKDVYSFIDSSSWTLKTFTDVYA